VQGGKDEKTAVKLTLVMRRQKNEVYFQSGEANKQRDVGFQMGSRRYRPMVRWGWQHNTVGGKKDRAYEHIAVQRLKERTDRACGWLLPRARLIARQVCFYAGYRPAKLAVSARVRGSQHGGQGSAKAQPRGSVKCLSAWNGASARHQSRDALTNGKASEAAN